jgi:hypothetical protein
MKKAAEVTLPSLFRIIAVTSALRIFTGAYCIILSKSPHLPLISELAEAMKRIALFLVLVFLCCLAAFPAAASGNDRPPHILLSWTGGTDTTMTISWRAYATDGAGIVRYGTDPALGAAKTVEAAQAVLYSGIPTDFTVFHTPLTGLNPGTTYYYCVGNDSGWSDISYFTTAEQKTDAFSFLYMGDIHMGEGSADAWSAFHDGAYKRNPGVSFGVFGGDLVDSGFNLEEWQSLLNDASSVFSKIPLMPTNGNHESNFPGGKPAFYLDMFDLPQNGPEGFEEEFYSYDYGNCHITVMNSWVFSGEQKVTESDYKKISNWLIEDLAASRAVWKIVVMHHPVYTLASDKVADAVRKNWAPLFEQCGVSLILCGHQHVYSRSYPMTNGQIDYADGITTVMGNASQKFYSSADETFQAKTICNVSNYQIVRIDGETLTVQSYDADGNELDYCSLKPRSLSGAPAVFTDVPNDAWYAPAVNYAAQRGLMSGTSESVFSPDMPLTRAMASVLLYRLAGLPKTTANAAETFSDVTPGAWYIPAVSWLSANGVMSGTGGGLFSPDALLTREQLAAALCRFAAYEKTDVSAAGTLSGFADATDVSPWAQSAVTWAVGQGLLSGSGGQLNPQDTASRAQTAAVLMKFCLSYAR